MGKCLLACGGCVVIGFVLIALCSAFAATEILRHGNVVQAMGGDTDRA